MLHMLVESIKHSQKRLFSACELAVAAVRCPLRTSLSKRSFRVVVWPFAQTPRSSLPVCIRVVRLLITIFSSSRHLSPERRLLPRLHPIIHRVRHVPHIPRPVLRVPLRPQQSGRQLPQDLVVVGRLVDPAPSGRGLAVRDQGPRCGEFLEALNVKRSQLLRSE